MRYYILNPAIAPLGSRLNEEDLQRLSRQFSRIDLKHDGYIDIDEFRISLGIFSKGQLRNSTSPPQHTLFLRHLFSVFDHNGSGVIEESDFKFTMGILTRGTPDERLDFAVHFIDCDGKGEITKQSLFQIMESIYTTIGFMFQRQLGDPTMFVETLWASISASVNSLSVNDDPRRSLALKRDKISRDEFIMSMKARPENMNLIRRLGLIGQVPQDTFSGSGRSSPDTIPIFFGDPEWRKVLAMMLGIQMALDAFSMNATDFELVEPDYSCVMTHSLPLLLCEDVFSGDLQTAISDKFIDFAPLVFRWIRHLFGVTEEEYKLALSIEQVFGGLVLGRLTTLSGKSSDGKSGSFFFFSHDERFLLKTISTAERETLLRILPNYVKHIESDRDTLLARLYGLHQLKDVCFVVMENVFNTDKQIHHIFDLKGSTFGRTNPEGPVKKDLDFDQQVRIRLGFQRKGALMDQLERDIRFLENLSLIDYSLLVGIHDCTPSETNAISAAVSTYSQQPQNGLSSKRKPFWREEHGGLFELYHKHVYYFGVIDFLIEYSLRKEVEHSVKMLYYGDGCSVVPPAEYASRFLNFIESHIE